MILAELLLMNKSKYTRVFLIRNDEVTNEAVFEELFESEITPELSQTNAKDYFLLDREAIDEIFGNSDELGISDEDNVLIIGI